MPSNALALLHSAAFVVSVVSAIGTAFGILYTRRSASSDRISAIADQSALKVAKEQLAIEQARRYKEMEERGDVSDRAQQNRDIKATNDNLAQLKNELADSEKRLAELKRQLAASGLTAEQCEIAEDAIFQRNEGDRC